MSVPLPLYTFSVIGKPMYEHGEPTTHAVTSHVIGTFK